MHHRTLLFFLVPLLLLGLSIAAAAGEKVPLKGTDTGRVTSITPLDASHLFFTAFVTGHATHLGQFTGEAEVIQNVDDGSFIGSVIWTVANGDSLSISFSGQLVPTGTPGLFTNIEAATITGGTGRFVGASGSMTFGGYADLSDPSEITFVHPFSGSISTVGSNKK